MHLQGLHVSGSQVPAAAHTFPPKSLCSPPTLLLHLLGNPLGPVGHHHCGVPWWESRSSLHTPKPSKRLTKKEGKRTAPCVCLCLDSRPLLCFLPSRTQLQVQASEPRAAKRYLVSRRHYLLEPWRGPCRTIENTVPGVTFITCPQK